MISRIPLVFVLCAVLFGAFGQVAISATDGGTVVVTNTGLLNDTNYTKPATNFRREDIYHKLDRIHFDELPTTMAEGMPLSEVIRYLDKQSKLLDPDKHGINVYFNPNTENGGGGVARIDPATGLPLVGGAAGSVGVGGVGEPVDAHTITVKLSLRDVSLRQLLDAVVLVADRPIKYTVEDFGVAFSAKLNSGDEPPLFETHVFKVHSRSFLAALQGVPVLQTNWVLRNALSYKSISSVLGVDLTAPGRSAAFKDTLGLLFVKATPSELETVEQALVPLNKDAPQVHIKARFIKLSEEDADAILKAGIVVDTKKKNTVEIMTEAKATPLLKKLESRGEMNVLNEPEVTTISGRQVLRTGSGNSIVDFNPMLLADDYTLLMRVTVSAPETLAAEANVWDDQTLVLASNNPGADKTRLFVFITTTVVDPAGNRVNSDANHSRFNPTNEIPQQHTLITTPSP